MDKSAKLGRAAVPSVDKVLRLAAVRPLLDRFGSDLVTDAVRRVTAEARESLAGQDPAAAAYRTSDDAVAADVAAHLHALVAPSLRPVLNLTGTVLHTNLGRAPLPASAIEAVVAVAGGASNLEFDLASGKRGDRDVHLEDWICRLTGAEAATVVNNNAAAVLLTLNSLARRKQVPVSRGELIEIGGSFRIPDVMARAGAKLVEVGTTNRTHLRDFEQAVGPRTALVMKVHTSNFEVRGFTAAVPEPELAALARAHGIPFVVDLGSGTLVDLARFGLPSEVTVAETLEHGADLVTFSGDKLLGGPQAGIIAGRADLIDKIRRNPMKRALRLDKMTIAALSAVLRLYGDPGRLAERVPALRLLSRSVADIEAAAHRLAPRVAAVLDGVAAVEVVAVKSQIGSGALPTGLLPSAAIRMTPPGAKRKVGAAVRRLAAAFRALPVPVIGRIDDGGFVLDLRCLDDEAAFVDQLSRLPEVLESAK
jgi:L-seryl-tRNA(Ser) seleniumtransferase